MFYCFILYSKKSQQISIYRSVVFLILSGFKRFYFPTMYIYRDSVENRELTFVRIFNLYLFITFFVKCFYLFCTYLLLL